MLEFPLEDWEWPGRAEERYVVEPFEMPYQWPTGLKNTLVCSVELEGFSDRDTYAPVYFRPMEGSSGAGSETDGVLNDQANHILLASRHGRRFYCFCTRRSTRASLLSSLENAWNSGTQLQPARLIPLRRLIMVIEDKQGWCCYNPNLTYRFRLPFSCAALPSDQIYAWVQSELADLEERYLSCDVGTRKLLSPGFAPDEIVNAASNSSDIAFAYRWHFTQLDVRRTYILQLYPRLQELRLLLQSIMTSELQQGELVCWYPCLADSESEANSEPATEPDTTIHGRIEYGNVRLPESHHQALLQRLEVWRRVVKRFFPLPPLDETTTPQCILDHYREYYGHSLAVWADSSSAHERLEAALQLREWAQGKATPEEMAVLFPAT